jgi:histidinol-phosphate aminotransferase
MPILGLPPSSKPVYPSHFDIESVIRPNILALHPYRCARDDYQEGILLDANENSLGHSILHGSENGDANEHVLPEELRPILHLDLHRYPDPSHPSIKERIAFLRGLSSPAFSGSDHIFLGVGSDEVIDLLIRVCIKPGGEEKILITPPTYGMYTVCAQINDVGVIKVPLELTGQAGEHGAEGRFSVRVDEVGLNRLNHHCCYQLLTVFIDEKSD